MTKFIDVNARDLLGAANQWNDYITGTLGYDCDVGVQVGFENGRGSVWLRAGDKFQAGVPYGDIIGRCGVVLVCNPEDEFEPFCQSVWDRLKKLMPRDERELRAGMKMMGAFIESAPSFTSAVGKMIAERIKATRDEATNYMIEHHGWKPETQAAE